MSDTIEKRIRIGELAKQLGITTRTIRYYEEIGLMGVSPRSGGIRSYDRSDILRLKFILKMKELNLSLNEMQDLAKNYDAHQQDFKTLTPRLVELLDLHTQKVDEKIAKLSSLRKEIVAYRSRIEAILQGKELPVK